jgi:mannose-6-phosphate isomerase-like protein (cupin superfamily)
MIAHARACYMAAVLGLAFATTAAIAQNGLDEPILVNPDGVVWSDGPPSLPDGAELAVLEGDLTREEPYVFRLRLPDGYQVMPHSHPVREHITVLGGKLMMGHGEDFDREATEPLGPGSLYVLPVGDHHYVWTEGETVVQLHGTGPWGINYVNPADDPRNASK